MSVLIHQFTKKSKKRKENIRQLQYLLQIFILLGLSCCDSFWSFHPVTGRDRFLPLPVPVKQRKKLKRIFPKKSNYGKKIKKKRKSIGFSVQTCPSMVFLVKNRKSEHHHQMWHSQINLGTKFQFKRSEK